MTAGAVSDGTQRPALHGVARHERPRYPTAAMTRRPEDRSTPAIRRWRVVAGVRLPDSRRRPHRRNGGVSVLFRAGEPARTRDGATSKPVDPDALRRTGKPVDVRVSAVRAVRPASTPEETSRVEPCNREPTGTLAKRTSLANQRRVNRRRGRTHDVRANPHLPSCLSSSERGRNRERANARPRSDVPTSHSGWSCFSRPMSEPIERVKPGASTSASLLSPSPEGLDVRSVALADAHHALLTTGPAQSVGPTASELAMAHGRSTWSSDRSRAPGAAALVCRLDASIETTRRPNCVPYRPRSRPTEVGRDRSSTESRLGRCPELSLPFNA